MSTLGLHSHTCTYHIRAQKCIVFSDELLSDYNTIGVVSKRCKTSFFNKGNYFTHSTMSIFCQPGAAHFQYWEQCLGSWAGFSDKYFRGELKGTKGNCCLCELTSCSLASLVPATSQETYMKASGKTICAMGKAE